jgi:mono/diheme cytochrome c family protein
MPLPNDRPHLSVGRVTMSGQPSEDGELVITGNRHAAAGAELPITRRARGRTQLVGLALVAGLACAAPAGAQETADFFKQNCASCHTIGGGRLTGPDLKNVTKEQDRDWLTRFLLDPKAMIDSGDPYAQKLLQEARGVVMPTVAGMNRERAESLLTLIEAESKRERSAFAGVQVPSKPFTPEEIAEGRDIFRGRRRLADGGPACLSCHTLNGVGALGGGRLGPDLTTIYERMEGRKGLAAWLAAPPTPTMQPLFKPHPLRSEEILPIVAYLEDAARRGGEAASLDPLNFFLLGLMGAGGSLMLFQVVWKDRFRAVRRPLVHNGRGKRG